MPLAVLADQVVLTDDFTMDSSLGSQWLTMYSTPAYTAQLNPSPGQGLALGVTAGTGKIVQEFAQFSASPLTLVNVGDYVSLTVTFNSSTMTANNGYLLTGLYNTMGTVATANLANTVVGGPNADDTGYAGLLDFNTYANGSTKWYEKNGGATANNEMAYYSAMAAGTYTQVLPGSYSPSTAGVLLGGVNYTMTYTITKAAGGNTISTVIKNTDTSAVMDNWSLTDSSGLYNSFDELDFGFYGKNGTLPNPGVNILDITVMTNIPEPATFALAGLGLLGLLIVRRARR